MTKKAKKLPSMQFYPGDWLKDPGLRACSPAARGVWMDVLCLMFEAEQRGVLRVKNGSKLRAISIKKLSKSIAGCKPKLLQELIDNGVMRVARKDGAFYSKRLIREELQRRRKAKAGEKGGKQKVSKTEANTQAKTGSSSSSSTSVLTNTLSRARARGKSYTIEQVKNAAFLAGVTEQEAEQFYHHFNAQGWVRANGQAIHDLPSAIAYWQQHRHEFKPRASPENQQERTRQRLEALQAEGKL